MDKHEVAALLERFSVLLELTEEDPFRSRAYTNAAYLIENQTESLESLVKENRLSEIKGIGKSMSAIIREIFERGTFAELEAAEDKVPPGIFDLLKVDGLGPKKAKTLWKEAQVTSLESLESAIREGSLTKLSGFGDKTLTKFLTSIEFLKRQSGRHLRHHATRAVLKLTDLLKDIHEINEVFVGGSARRGCETVGDLDVLLVSEKPTVEIVQDKIKRLAGIEWSDSETEGMKGRFAEFELDISVCSPKQAAFRKLICTGSKHHYQELCKLAEQLGFKLFPDHLTDSFGRLVPISTEEEIFFKLGLEPIPPALREDSVSLFRKVGNAFPDSVQLSDLRGILHVHSTYSDGHHTLRELTEAMIQAGYSYLGIADHSQSAAYARGLTPERVHAQWQEIDELNQEFAPFKILKGTETDILSDGRLDFEDEILAGFDFVIASIHSGFNMTEDQATQRLCKALANPHVDILGHMTGRLLLTRNGYPVNHEKVIACAAEHGKAIELNANPFRLDIDWRWLHQCEEVGVPVPITPDAHAISGLSDVQYGIEVAAKGPLSKNNCLSTWNTEQFMDWCSKHK